MKMKKLFCHNIKILYYECSCRNHREASNETTKMVIKSYKVRMRKEAQPAVKEPFKHIPEWFKGQHKNFRQNSS
jgi:hypothetical protein